MRSLRGVALFCLAGLQGGWALCAPPAPSVSVPAIQELLEQGEPEEAVRLARELVRQLDSLERREPAVMAAQLDQLVETLAEGNVERPWGLELAKRATALRLRLEGESAAYARSLRTYGRYLFWMGQEEEAIQQIERVLAICQRLLPPGDPAIAATLNTLGAIHTARGDWIIGRDCYERALRIYEQSEGYSRREARVTLFNLAELLDDLGDYAAVRELWEGLVRDMELRPETSPLLFARAHGWIASMSHRLGQEQPALAHYEMARKAWGSDAGQAELARRANTPEAANTTIRIALTARALGLLDDAKEFCLRGIAARERLRGKDHPIVAGDLIHMAETLFQAGEDAPALPYLERADSIEQQMEETNRFASDHLRLYAAVLRRLGRLDEARAVLARALAGAIAIDGEEHPALCPILAEQARLALTSGDPNGARDRALRAEAIAARHLERMAAWLSQGEALRYQQARLTGLDVALSSIGGGVAAAPAAVESVWDAVIRGRGAVLDEVIARRRIVATSDDPAIHTLVGQLENDRSRLAHVVFRGPGDETAESHAERLRRLIRSQESTERRLASRSAVFRQRLVDQAAGWQQILAALPPDAALVAYVRYERFHRSGSSWIDTPEYLALVKPARSGPQAVRLGEAGAIEALISRWRQELVQPHQGSLTPEQPDQSPAGHESGQALRQAIWDPVARRLGRERVILVVLDGALHQVSLAALPGEQAQFLVEEDRAFHYLGTERDLRASHRPRAGTGLLALGAPDFDLALGPKSLTAVTAPRGGPDEEASTTRWFPPLAGSRSEVQGIVRLWREGQRQKGSISALLLEGQGATKAAFFKGVPGRQVIHLATHAFDDAIDSRPVSTSRGLPLPINPLLSSGLAMAGANRPTLDDDRYGGVLLAEEVLSLDLSSVGWVVLSACGTGLGPIQAREGVHGLKRSFQAAGAQTVVTTLWEVEDWAAHDWMISLYRARLDGASTVEAMRLASLEFILSARRNGRIPQPCHWGGFVATGDWR